MLDLVVVAIGGAIGSVSRYLIGNFIAKNYHGSFPVGTFTINILGCFLMGMFMSSLIQKEMVDTTWRLFLGVGLLGGFTTFSSFALETDQLMRNGHAQTAFCYVIASIVCGVAAVLIAEKLIV